MQKLAKAGIAFDRRFAIAGARTITKTRVLVRNQQLCRLDFEDAPAQYRSVLSPKRLRLIESKILRCDGIILSDYAKGVLSTESISRINAFAHKHGKFVACDPKPASGNEFFDLDLITPNRKEAIELSGLLPTGDDKADLARICAKLWRKYRSRTLVVTLGADGMLTSAKGRIQRQIPTAARQVYDVSGAGDTVIAALTLALTSGANLEQAAHFANAAAGVVVGKLGTATVTPAELTEYLA